MYGWGRSPGVTAGVLSSPQVAGGARGRPPLQQQVAPVQIPVLEAARLLRHRQRHGSLRTCCSHRVPSANVHDKPFALLTHSMSCDQCSTASQVIMSCSLHRVLSTPARLPACRSSSYLSGPHWQSRCSQAWSPGLGDLPQIMALTLSQERRQPSNRCDSSRRWLT